MDRRKQFSSLVLISLALALSGLGHYYLLYQRVYVWDIVVFYAMAAWLSAWAYRRAEAVPERSRALVRSALRRLRAALRRLLFRRPNRLLVAALATANGLAALVAFLIPSPMGLLLALPLWAVGVVVALGTGWRIAGRRPQIASAVRRLLLIRPAIAAPTAQPPRNAVPMAIGGWLSLAAGLVVLGLDGMPRLLETLDAWLRPRLADLHVDAPMPPGIWLPGLLLLLVGVMLISRTTAGPVRLPGIPSFTIPALHTAAARPPRRFLLLVLALALAGTLVWLGVVGAAVAGTTHWSVIPRWLAALAVQAVCWWRVDRARGVSPLSHLAPLEGSEEEGRGGRGGSFTWLAVLALMVAFGVTLYRLGDVPNSVWGDEGAFWTLARDLAAGVVRISPFDLGVYSAFPLIGSLYQSLWIRVFGPTLWSWRLGSVVAGTLTIVPLFFLIRKLLGTRVAWSAVVLMVGMPYFLAYTRIGFNNIQPLLPITVGLWLLIEAVQRHSCTLAYLAGVACGMASLTYTSGHVGLVLAALVWLFFFIGQRPLRRLLIRLLLCTVVGWLFAAGPFVLGCVLGGKPLGWKVMESFIGNAFYGQAIFSPAEITQRHPLWQVGQQQIFFEPRLYTLLIGRGLVRTVLSMVVDGVTTQHYLVGPLAGPGTVFFLVGLAWALGRCRRLYGLLWAMWTLVCVALFSVLNTFPPRPAHLTPVIPALAVLAATGIWLLSGLLRQVVRPRWADWIGGMLTVVLALWGLRAYFVTMPQRYVPNSENVMFWRAQEMGRGSNLVFVANASYPSEFRVWGIDQFDLGVDYHNVLAEDVQIISFRALCGTTCRVFFLPEDADIVHAKLHAQLGAGTIQTHVDAEGRTVVLEFVPP